MSIYQAAGLCGATCGLLAAGVMGQAFGWRIALGGLGLLGLPVAAVVFFFLRGKSFAPAASAPRPVLDDLRTLATASRFKRVTLAISLASFATYANHQWISAFFLRAHGVTLSKVGILSGVSTGLGGMVGALFGGYVAARLMPRNINWDLRVPMIVYALAAPLYIIALTAHSTSTSVIWNFIATCVGASGGGVVLAGLQRCAPRECRATANAVMLIVSAIAGIGFGPVAVGLLSDALSGSLGHESLRWAMIASALAFTGASVCLLWAGVPAKSDLAQSDAQEELA
jgi:predicted MFS family arabinose efflux permease